MSHSKKYTHLFALPTRTSFLPVSLAKFLSTSLILFLICVLLNPPLSAQELDTTKMNSLFQSLEERNEAMGSLVITKNCTILYKKAFGFRYQDDETRLPADPQTRYRIWSITKTFTATLILQLVEAGKLSLETSLAQFFPQIPHADKISMKLMLKHRSGIRDFTEDPAPIWEGKNRAEISPEDMVERIATYEPTFLPGEDIRYSNSNYLLLGYIIEQLTEMPYQEVLEQKISSKIGLKQTSFNQAFPRKNGNDAFSFSFDQQWDLQPEGDARAVVPAAAGGIISTPTDIALFIESLFAGKLISASSLALMLDDADSYGLGIYRNDFQDHTGYGHSGAYLTSFSDLTYYPEDSLAIAYCTNGLVYPKELILEHVLRIIHGKPFAVSSNRAWLLSICFLLMAIFLGILIKNKSPLLQPERLLNLGVIIPIVYWTGQLIGGLLYGDYSFQQQGPLDLGAYYSNSGSFMAVWNLILWGLVGAFFLGVFKTCKSLKISIIPSLPILSLVVCMGGKALFPTPHPLAVDFDQIYLLSFLGPLLSLIFWRKKLDATTRTLCILSLVFMLIPAGLFISRVYPEFTFHYAGLLQRIIHVGWGIWFIGLGIFLTNFREVHSLSAEESLHNPRFS